MTVSPVFLFDLFYVSHFTRLIGWVASLACMALFGGVFRVYR